MERNRGGKWQKTAAVGRNRLAQQKQIKHAFVESRARNRGVRLDDNINDAEVLEGADVFVCSACGKGQSVARDALRAGDVFCACGAPLGEDDVARDDESLTAGVADSLKVDAARRMAEKTRRAMRPRAFKDGGPSF